MGGGQASQILQQQQALTQQVLQLMGRQPATGATATTGSAPPATPASLVQSVPMVFRSEAKSHGPFKPIDRAASLATTPQQTAALEELIARYI